MGMGNMEEVIAALFGEAGELAALVGEAVGTRSLSGGRSITRRTGWYNPGRLAALVGTIRRKDLSFQSRK